MLLYFSFHLAFGRRTKQFKIPVSELIPPVWLWDQFLTFPGAGQWKTQLCLK